MKHRTAKERGSKQETCNIPASVYSCIVISAVHFVSMGGLFFMERNADVEFTVQALKQYRKLQRERRGTLDSEHQVKKELESFIAAHEASKHTLDRECQEVHYANGLYLIIRKMQGTWYILDMTLEEEPDEFRPVFIWQQIKRGFRMILVHVLTCWRNMKRVFA